jgi:hypothetical protein
MICMTITSSRPATPDSYVPSRRTVLRAAAWTAPAVSVAVAVPAYAACSNVSPVTGVVDWDATTGSGRNRRAVFSPSDSRGGTYTLSQTGADALSVKVAAGYENNMRPLDQWTMRTHSPVGGLSGVSGLCLAQYNSRSTARAAKDRRLDRGTYTVTFGRPVTNLFFTVTDIDSLPGDYIDKIELSAVVPHAEMGQKGAGVTGAGTLASPYTPINGNRQVPDPASSAGNVSASSGNVRVQFPGAISSFTLTYWNDVAQFTEDTTQGVWISDMSFQYSPSATC